MIKYPEPNYTDRKERNTYCLNLLKSSFPNVNTILNLGGGQKRYLKESSYKVTEVDIDGDNDFNIDLDSINKLPFENNSFDCVICLDVLEHLENFHLILDEINRVSNKYIIISLPNCFVSFFNILLNKKTNNRQNNGYHDKFYGLPFNKPIDRHRWFFSINDIESFFINYASKKNIRLDFLFPLSKSYKSKILSLFLSKRLKREILTKYAWIILKK